MKILNLETNAQVLNLTFPDAGTLACWIPVGELKFPATVTAGTNTDSLGEGEVIIVLAGGALNVHRDKTYMADFFMGFGVAFPMVLTLICYIMVKRGLRPSLEHAS